VPEAAGALHWRSFVDDPAGLDAAPAVEAGGPAFLAELTAGHRDLLSGRAPGTQWVVRDVVGDPVAVVRALETRWDGTRDRAPGGSIGALIGTLAEDPASPSQPPPGERCLTVVDLTVHPARRGVGLGTRVLTSLPAHAAEQGFTRLLVLLRPHAKRDHPLVPFARYVAATDAAGRPLDGWLAAAWGAGLHPVRAVDRSLVARAPVQAWRRWYGRPFPTSGPYLVDGAIKPAIVETERDEGRYREPHLWVAPPGHLVDRTVDPASLRRTSDGWLRALAAAGVVAGSRRHREPRRPR
jgi:GNAT superfamily N-acetyltransferase